MFNLFAHASHAHDTETLGQASFIDHCTPVIVIAALVITFLITVLVYLLLTWQPKSFTATNKTVASSKKRTTKK